MYYVEVRNRSLAFLLVFEVLLIVVVVMSVLVFFWLLRWPFALFPWPFLCPKNGTMSFEGRLFWGKIHSPCWAVLLTKGALHF